MEKGVSSPFGFIWMQKKLNQSETAMKPREDDQFYCREPKQTMRERKVTPYFLFYFIPTVGADF